MTKQVLILGASGMAGSHSAQAFAEAGWAVRRFDRKANNMVEAAMGCDIIVNAFNPPNYHDWKTNIPAITGSVIKAAQASGATVIIPGNVYHFGNEGGVWSERTLARPNSRKGEIRLQMEETYKASGVQTIVLRAGNFIDPASRQDILSLLHFRNLKQRKIVLPGPAHARQAMCYIGDWARAAAELAAMRSELGRFEDVPFPGYTLRGIDIQRLAEAELGHPLKGSEFPWTLFKLLGPFWEFAREMNEMRYLYATDHSLCGKRLQALLPDFQVTPIEKVMKRMLSAS
ncbi:MAG: NAD-dependent epimerase/dehydratase family protein [Pseudomonadota bacterium]